MTSNPTKIKRKQGCKEAYLVNRHTYNLYEKYLGDRIRYVDKNLPMEHLLYERRPIVLNTDSNKEYFKNRIRHNSRNLQEAIERQKKKDEAWETAPVSTHIDKLIEKWKEKGDI